MSFGQPVFLCGRTNVLAGASMRRYQLRRSHVDRRIRKGRGSRRGPEGAEKLLDVPLRHPQPRLYPTPISAARRSAAIGRRSTEPLHRQQRFRRRFQMPCRCAAPTPLTARCGAACGGSIAVARTQVYDAQHGGVVEAEAGWQCAQVLPVAM